MNAQDSRAGAPRMPSYTQRCYQRGPEALIEILRDHGPFPDHLGEIRNLPRSTAALIRSCGYTARAGQTWRCPLLPDALVRGYPLFEHLSDGDWIAPRWGDGPYDWHPKRAQFRPISPIDPVWSHEKGILELLDKQPDKRLTRRQLQQRVSRRFWTEYLDRMLERLAALDRITVHDGWIYPCSRGDFDARQREARNPRRKLVYEVWPDGSRSYPPMPEVRNW